MLESSSSRDAELAAKDARITELEARVTELESIIQVLSDKSDQAATAAPPRPPGTPPPPQRPGRKAADEGKATDELTVSEKKKRKRRRQQAARRGAQPQAAGRAAASSAADGAADRAADGPEAALAAEEEAEEATEEAAEDEPEDAAEEEPEADGAEEVPPPGFQEALAEQLHMVEVELEYHLRLAEFAERERAVLPAVDCKSCVHCQTCSQQQDVFRRHVLTGLFVQNEVEAMEMDAQDGMWPGVPNDGTLLCEWYARHSASLQAAGASGNDVSIRICETRMRIWEGLREALGPHSREEARAAWARAEARVDAQSLRPPPQADSVQEVAEEMRRQESQGESAVDSGEDDELALAMEVSLTDMSGAGTGAGASVDALESQEQNELALAGSGGVACSGCRDGCRGICQRSGVSGTE